LKGVLPWLIHWAGLAGTRDFSSTLAALIGPIVWTPFNKLGRMYGKEINESAKKSLSFLTKNPGVGRGN
jgi:hypothetical protein